MLCISETQWRVFERLAEQQFEARALTFLRHRYPQACAALGERLPRLLVGARSLAGMCGIRCELGVVTICELALTYGTAFHRTEGWASYILNFSNADAHQRVARLREYLP